MAKAKEMRDQALDELKASYDDQRKELFQLKNEREATKQFEKPHRIRLKKRDIARLLTIIREKQSAEKKKS